MQSAASGLQRIRSASLVIVFLGLFGLPPFCGAAQSTILKVGESGAELYRQNDRSSEKIRTLKAGDEVVQIIQTIGIGSWYLVETADGRRGWVASWEVEPVRRREPAPKADQTVVRFGSRSTWSARTRSGKSLHGTWTGAFDRSTAAASGSWTVRDGRNRIVLRGTWSAVKSTREWRGSWRALISGETRERSGTWASKVPLPPSAPLNSLFEQAVSRAINGTWQSANRSGSWSIRVVP